MEEWNKFHHHLYKWVEECCNYDSTSGADISSFALGSHSCVSKSTHCRLGFMNWQSGTIYVCGIWLQCMEVTIKTTGTRNLNKTHKQTILLFQITVMNEQNKNKILCYYMLVSKIKSTEASWYQKIFISSLFLISLYWDTALGIITYWKPDVMSRSGKYFGAGVGNSTLLLYSSIILG